MNCLKYNCFDIKVIVNKKLYELFEMEPFDCLIM